MAKIFITGSSDGIGFLAAKSLITKGHQVVFHARNDKRKEETLQKLGSEQIILTGDLANREETIKLSEAVNELGKFDAIIHNAGVYSNTSAEQMFAVNVLAPHILTSLIKKPERLIYVTSDMHKQGKPKLDDLQLNISRVNYSDSKLHVLMLAMIVARKWPGVYSNAVNPGWVPTKMGGNQAPDDLQKGFDTQVWLATSLDKQAKVSGRYFFHQKEYPPNPDVKNTTLQDKLIELCQEITGVQFPD